MEASLSSPNAISRTSARINRNASSQNLKPIGTNRQHRQLLVRGGGREGHAHDSSCAAGLGLDFWLTELGDSLGGLGKSESTVAPQRQCEPCLLGKEFTFRLAVRSHGKCNDICTDGWRREA